MSRPARGVVGVLVALATATLLATPASSAPRSTASEGDAPQPAAGASAEPGLVTFGIAPSGIDRPDDRPFLQYTVGPGTVFHDNVAVINLDDAPLALDVYAGDVGTGRGGGLVVPGRAAAPTGPGAWVSMTASQVDVPPQSTATGVGFTVVPFTVSVPRDAEPGDHVGAIIVALTAKGEASADLPAVDLEQRVAARLYITVDGDLAPGLVITQLGATYDAGSLVGAGSVTASYTVANTGNVRMAVEPRVRVSGPFGLLARTAVAPRIDELLPGSKVGQTVSVEGVWPLVRLSTTASATGLAPAAASGADPGVGTVSSAVGLWTIPWLLLAILAAAAVGIAWRTLRRVRRRSPAAPSGSRPVRRGGGVDLPALAGSGTSAD
ncbi:hypothetical protein [Cellulomonas sp.]|uniref:hypothetical protein n=1 Tax=Cellulomonas sp. TaxID=40001 RepID=UPI003BAB72CB